MNNRGRLIALCGIGGIVSGVSALTVYAQSIAGYTETQAQAGKIVYEKFCASCHLPDLRGAFEAPELAGPNFMNKWGGSAASAFFSYSRATMPPTGDRPGGEELTNITAYILQRNGFPAGPVALVATSSSPIGRPQTRRTGTWHGTVEGFIPVTEAELRNPPPGDWLMFRRTYDGWGYSPLDRISRKNVSNLELAWVWAMEDGTNQPTPLVRNGIMYLTNPDNVIQALDARTCDVIWEYRREFPQGFSGRGTLRNLAIYQDMIFVSANDAALVALDARTGDIRWEAQIADPGKGYTNSSGPLVVNGIVINGISGCERFREGRTSHPLT